MTFKKLVKEIAAREGLKKQVDIAQITEILGHVADILAEDMPWEFTYERLVKLGQQRLKKKAKKSKK